MLLLRAALPRVAAPLVLASGYAALAHGETTLAPVLLLVGYLVLVPALILGWP